MRRWSGGVRAPAEAQTVITACTCRPHRQTVSQWSSSPAAQRMGTAASLGLNSHGKDGYSSGLFGVVVMPLNLLRPYERSRHVLNCQLRLISDRRGSTARSGPLAGAAYCRRRAAVWLVI